MSDNSDNVCTSACSIAHSHTENYRQFHRVLLIDFDSLEFNGVDFSSGFSLRPVKRQLREWAYPDFISLDNSLDNGDIYY